MPAPAMTAVRTAGHHLVERPAFVVVDPAGEHEGGAVADFGREEAAAVTGHPGNGKAGAGPQ